jgi:4-O-beta-D-mannosyl-D-glucose phosphorylase
MSASIDEAVIEDEIVVLDRRYHTITEAKNGLGPAPIRTERGWLQLAHGVRGTAAGLRYVLYAFMTALDEPWRVIHEPGGYLLAPQGEEYVGDVMNVVFSNGWIAREDGELFIYYASSDSRCHVATTTVERMVDYCRHTPPDPLTSAACVRQRIELIGRNLRAMRGESES